MTLLHGCWLGGSNLGDRPPGLFLWHETWRSQAETGMVWQDNPPVYPLAIADLEPWADLLDPIDPVEKFDASEIEPFTAILALPGYQDTESGVLYPLPAAAPSEDDLFPESVALYPWQVKGWYLAPEIALNWLTRLPLSRHGSNRPEIGGDLRFWAHVNRWLLDLLVRSKFLPRQESADPNFLGLTWQPLLDRTGDRQRFRTFARTLPDVCRTVQEPMPAVAFPGDGAAILWDFLVTTLTAQIHRSSHNLEIAKTGLAPEHSAWLQRLIQPSPQLSPVLKGLPSSLAQWQQPLEGSLDLHPHWRLCFHLQPPDTKTGKLDATSDQPWFLAYGLQSEEQTDHYVPAENIWNTAAESMVYQGSVIRRPQETLLRGLGLATRLYPLLESSLIEPCPRGQCLEPGQVYEFLRLVSGRLEDSGFGMILPPGLSRRGRRHRLGLTLQAQLTPMGQESIGLNALLDFHWQLSLGGQVLSQDDFQKLVNLNTPLVEINGQWLELQPQDIKAAQTFFAQRSQQRGLSLGEALRIATGDTVTLEKLPVVGLEANDALQALLDALTGKQTLEPIENPPGFMGELRPYQARGVSWLSFLERWRLGACLADDMGLGKTIQLLAFLLHLKAQKNLKAATLLICPTSVLGNWEREIKRFAPEFSTLVHHGSGRAKGKKFLKAIAGKAIILTSYALVHRDLSTLGQVSWQNLVLDEAQNIKNSETQQSQAVRQLDAQFRIALTGTPLENRLTELWSIMDFLHPGYLGNRAFFQRRYALPIERYGDATSLQALKTYVQPFILRRLKTDREIIQDLPEKQEMTVFCSLTPEQAALYKATVDQSLADIEASTGIQRRGLVLATLTKLKQICNHPSQFLKEKDLTPNRSGKLNRLDEMIAELLDVGDRALIFTQFAEMGKLLQAHLSQTLNQEILFLYGSTSKNKREQMIDRFQRDPQAPAIFILSLKAGGVGLNLTRANHVFHFDRWWNPAVENQATDRAFRIGQHRNVQVHKFVCAGTLEERIHEQIERKKALSEQVVGAGEQWLTELDSDQLRHLLLLDPGAIIETE
ncbi:DEAD/DEAH box helicase [Candidatus Synechococcus calcipolaris G9]|uniref:DEAD/DEAH box helicase n=1 Tax=Candidatus Synechococcus calcipolaris G9 TaxID=1497997 RepID=A0ABT6F0C4_9SYNE|nr:DEAD/DEAH box helicase [Candidatus Synechococcus calcipolaris]MDG2991311.1 DEAD/DEAH box helicase [Candidatus Synechococcus calcipolaris G9]